MQNSGNANFGDPKFFSAYGEKQKIQTHFSGLGRTKQSFKDECDINQILSRFNKTGVLEYTNKNEPRYGDVTGIEYQNAMNTVASANTLFNELPSHIRDRFDNDPAEFLDFVQDDKNTEEARELGLLKAQEEPEPLPDRKPTPSPKPAPAAPKGPAVAANKQAGGKGTSVPHNDVSGQPDQTFKDQFPT